MGEKNMVSQSTPSWDWMTKSSKSIKEATEKLNPRERLTNQIAIAENRKIGKKHKVKETNSQAGMKVCEFRWGLGWTKNFCFVLICFVFVGGKHH
jgi:hypothetical protein